MSWQECAEQYSSLVFWFCSAKGRQHEYSFWKTAQSYPSRCTGLTARCVRQKGWNNHIQYIQKKGFSQYKIAWAKAVIGFTFSRSYQLWNYSSCERDGLDRDVGWTAGWDKQGTSILKYNLTQRFNTPSKHHPLPRNLIVPSIPHPPTIPLTFSFSSSLVAPDWNKSPPFPPHFPSNSPPSPSPPRLCSLLSHNKSHYTWCRQLAVEQKLNFRTL
jgi:hypothetical protein